MNARSGWKLQNAVMFAAASIIYDLFIHTPSDSGPNGLIVIGFAALYADRVARLSGRRAGVIAGLTHAFVYLALSLAGRLVWQRLGGPSAWSPEAWKDLLFLGGISVLVALWCTRGVTAHRPEVRASGSDEQAI